MFSHKAVKGRESRRRPIFPGSYPPSIVGADELNYRVRDGNGWDLTAISTGYLFMKRKSKEIRAPHLPLPLSALS